MAHQIRFEGAACEEYLYPARHLDPGDSRSGAGKGRHSSTESRRYLVEPIITAAKNERVTRAKVSQKSTEPNNLED